jgi:hypothetical protein
MSTIDPRSVQDEVRAILGLVRERTKNQVPKPSITGLVAGGDDKDLQIATKDGVVAVPVDKIVQVTHPIPSRRDFVTVFLQDLVDVRSIFPVTSIWQAKNGVHPRGAEPSPELAEAFARASCHSSTAGAGESMTAGEVAGVSADDSEVHHSTDDCE